MHVFKLGKSIVASEQKLEPNQDPNKQRLPKPKSKDKS